MNSHRLDGEQARWGLCSRDMAGLTFRMIHSSRATTPIVGATELGRRGSVGEPRRDVRRQPRHSGVLAAADRATCCQQHGRSTDGDGQCRTRNAIRCSPLRFQTDGGTSSPGRGMTQSQGVTSILQCRSGSARSSNAAPTSSRPTLPVIIGVTSMSPSAIARSESPNSSGE